MYAGDVLFLVVCLLFVYAVYKIVTRTNAGLGPGRPVGGRLCTDCGKPFELWDDGRCVHCGYKSEDV